MKNGSRKRKAALSKSVSEIICSNVFTYFNFVFAALAVLLILARSFTSLTFLPVVLCNTGIGIFQELRAKRILDRLRILHEPRCRVLRQGKGGPILAEEMQKETEGLLMAEEQCREEEVLLFPEELQKGDRVLLSAGEQICGDGQLLSGELYVNEALLTGESEEIRKGPGDALLSGSFVISGEGCGLMTQVGQESYVLRLTEQVKSMKRGEQSAMLSALDRLMLVLGILILPVGLLLFCQGYFVLHSGFSASVVSFSAAVIGMIPQGLYLLTSIALAVGTIRLAKNQVLLHDMKCMETLARVDVLCVDKTGTITEQGMELEKIIPVGALEEETLHRRLGEFARAMTEDTGTMECLKAYFSATEKREALQVISFSAKTRTSQVIFPEGAYLLGAPEEILPYLRKVGEEAKRKLTEQVETFGEKGYRVLLFAFGKEEPEETLALLLFQNPLRAHAKEIFSYFKDQGVEVKILSGDHPQTVLRAAGAAGLLDRETEEEDRVGQKGLDFSKSKKEKVWLNASGLSEEELSEACLSTKIFGRMDPAQKQAVVAALKKKGKTVAMVGDGVNDILAMREANCSVALACGSKAAIAVSQLVLLDSDFSHMPAIVWEGRRVVNNIQRSAGLFLVKNIFSLLLAVAALAFAFSYPVLPTQVSLMGAFTIGLPGFFLALQPDRSPIKGDFFGNVLRRALPAGLTDLAAVLLFLQVSSGLGLSETESSTCCILLLTFVGFLLLADLSRPWNGMRLLTFGGSLCGMLLCSVLFGNLFSLVLPGKEALIFVLGVAGFSLFCFLFLRLLFEGLKRKFSKSIDEKNKISYDS